MLKKASAVLVSSSEGYAVARCNSRYRLYFMYTPPHNIPLYTTYIWSYYS